MTFNSFLVASLLYTVLGSCPMISQFNITILSQQIGHQNVSMATNCTPLGDSVRTWNVMIQEPIVRP